MWLVTLIDLSVKDKFDQYLELGAFSDITWYSRQEVVSAVFSFHAIMNFDVVMPRYLVHGLFTVRYKDQAAVEIKPEIEEEETNDE